MLILYSLMFFAFAILYMGFITDYTEVQKEYVIGTMVIVWFFCTLYSLLIELSVY